MLISRCYSTENPYTIAAMGDDLDAKIAAAIAAASQPQPHVHKHGHRRSTHASKKSSAGDVSPSVSPKKEETKGETVISSFEEQSKEEEPKMETVFGQSEPVVVPPPAPSAEEKVNVPSSPSRGGIMAGITDFLGVAHDDEPDAPPAALAEAEQQEQQESSSERSPQQNSSTKKVLSSKKSQQRKPRSESQGAEAVKAMKSAEVQSLSPMKEISLRGNIPISKLESERVSFSSTFRHRHVSPTKKSQVANLVNASGVDESKWDYMVETHESKANFQSWMEEKTEDDREKETMGIYAGDLRRKKSRFDSTSDSRSKLLHASISRHLAQNLKAKIGALPVTKPWSLLTVAMQADADMGKFAGPKKMAENMTTAVRIRPPTGEEMRKNLARIVTTVTVDRDLAASTTSSGLGGNDLAQQKVIVMTPQMTNEIGVDQLIHPVASDPQKTFPRDIATIYRFDHCFWSPLKNVSMPSMNEKGHIFATQQDLYASLGQPVVNNALNGISSCSFVYGPKGTGKSYSMFGDMNKEDQVGILPRVFSEIVDRVEQNHSHDTKCLVSFLEIYNEKVVDLLAFTHKDYNHNTRKSDHTRTLKIREHPVLGPYADGMRKVRVSKQEDVMSLVKEVLGRRASDESWMPRRDFAARRKNATLLCTMEITPDVISRQSQMDPYDPNQAHSICVHMVDLASGGANVGSVDTWRTSVLTGSTPSSMSLKNPLKVADISMSGNLQRSNRLESEVVKESACGPDVKTNKEMLALNEKRDQQSAHKSQSHLNYILHCLERGFDMRSLPFRDSVLTWLLRVALTSPNSKVTMLTSISPAENAYEETLHALKYSERLWSARKLRRFGHLSPTRPQRSGAPVDMMTASRDVGDDETIVSIATTGGRSDILNPRQNNSLSASRFRAHDDRVHTIRTRRSVEIEERPQWQKYLKQSPPRAAKKASAARGRQNTRYASVGPGGLRSSSTMRMSRNSERIDGEGDEEMQRELDMVRAERDAVLQQLESMSPGLAAAGTGTPESMVAELTQRLAEAETELRAFKTIKTGLDRSEDSVKDGSSKVDRLFEIAKNVGDSLRGGDPTGENALLKNQLADALDAASSATNDLVKLQKQTKEEFSELWTAVQQLKQHDANKDMAVEALVAERNDLRVTLEKSQARSKSLEKEIEMLDQALLNAVDTDARGEGGMGAADVSAIPLDTTQGGAGGVSEEFAHSVAQSPFTPEGTGRAGRSSTTTSGKSGKKEGKNGVTRPFSMSVPAAGGGGGGDSGGRGGKKSASARDVTGSVDETLQALGRFLVHDTNALSMQQGRINGSSPHSQPK